eukprot:354099-Chlamydomonas_euryale.AAC.1
MQPFTACGDITRCVFFIPNVDQFCASPPPPPPPTPSPFPPNQGCPIQVSESTCTCARVCLLYHVCACSNVLTVLRGSTGMLPASD